MLTIYRKTDSGYIEVPDKDILTVSLEEGHSDKYPKVLEAVGDTLCSELVVIQTEDKE
jgi:hypothetical protein